MAKIEKFEDLQCWQEARILCRLIFLLEGPITRDFGLKDQIRRAGVSVMNNIAEGFGRYSNLDTIRFLNFAQSSASEVKSMLYLLEDLKYLSPEKAEALHLQVDHTRNKILGFIRYLKNKQ